MRPVDHFLRRLVRLPNVGGKGWKFICPLATGDRQDMRDHVLKITVDARGAVGLFCHNGCSTKDVLVAMNLRFSDLYPVRPGRGRRGPAQSLAVKLAAIGLTEEQVRDVLDRRSRSRTTRPP
jgi:hypothetical protein